MQNNLYIKFYFFQFQNYFSNKVLRLKHIIDDGEKENIKWSEYNIKFVFSAEAFSEEFRQYLFNKTGQKNIYLDSLNHYGTVDQGTLAHETPLTTLIRKILNKNQELFTSLFGKNLNRLPTLAQYHPEMFYFEEVKGELVCTSHSGIPLVRYNLKDHGGILNFKGVKDKFLSLNIDLTKEAKKVDISDKIWHLPFVYVYERKDLSVSFCGANIYPEPIKKILLEDKFSEFFTGKFALFVNRDEKQDPYLEINIELKKDMSPPSPEIHKDVTDSIVKKLLEENSEYRSVYDEQKQEKAIPKIDFWPYESGNYFKVGGKQKWVIS